MLRVEGESQENGERKRTRVLYSTCRRQHGVVNEETVILYTVQVLINRRREVPKRAQTARGCGRREPNVAACAGAMGGCEAADELDDPKAFYLKVCDDPDVHERAGKTEETEVMRTR